MEHLHALHSKELLAHALPVAGDAESARDAVQEVFLRYFVERSYGRSIGNARAWLYRVLHNYLHDQRRRAPKREELLADDAGDIPDGRRGPEEVLRQSQFADQLTGRLTVREMECLRLRVDGLSYDEIADVLGVRPGTVSALLTRVHVKFRRALEDEAGEELDTAEALYYFLLGVPRFTRASTG